MAPYGKYKIALTTGSGKNIVERTLKEYDLAQFFEYIVTGEQYASSKADSECITLTLKKLHVHPSEAIIIEDSPPGIQAGKTAGCRVFALTTNLPKKDLQQADKIFDSHDEIRQFLLAKPNTR
jgi:beta-phosphoglucomutase